MTTCGRLPRPGGRVADRLRPTPPARHCHGSDGSAAGYRCAGPGRSGGVAAAVDVEDSAVDEAGLVPGEVADAEAISSGAAGRRAEAMDAATPEGFWAALHGAARHVFLDLSGRGLRQLAHL
jgi:hypothetical protein